MFLRCFLTFAKVQSNISYKKKRVALLTYYYKISWKNIAFRYNCCFHVL